MSRRSQRLMSMGYHDSEGKPNISYKENLNRVFKRRRFHSLPHYITSEDKAIDMDSGARGPARFPLMTFFSLLFLGLIFILPLSSDFLKSFSTTAMNKVCSTGCQETKDQLDKVQEKVMSLQHKINYLLPEADLLPNFALESLGACIVLERSSESFPPPKAKLTFFGIPIYQGQQKARVDPRIVIQGLAPKVPGKCWAFAGSRGELTLALSHEITISHVTLGHIPKMLSSIPSISNAPKIFSVSGMKNLEDVSIHLGTFRYDQDGDPLQTFRIPDYKRDNFRYVTLLVRSNWGNPDCTCLYSFRVHGKLPIY